MTETVDMPGIDSRRLADLGIEFAESGIARGGALRDCVKLLDTDGMIVYMSRNGLEAMEVDDLTQVRGKPWWSLWPEDARPMLREAVKNAASGEIASFVADRPTFGGTPFRWEVTIAAVCDGTGVVSQLVAISNTTKDDTRGLRPF